MGHPCPKILVFWQKTKNLQLFSKVTPERNRFSTQLVPAQAQLPIPVRPLPGFIFLCLAQVLKFLCMPPLLGLLCCFGLNLFSVQIHSFRLYVSSATGSWAKELFPVRCDFEENLIVLRFLPSPAAIITAANLKFCHSQLGERTFFPSAVTLEKI